MADEAAVKREIGEGIARLHGHFFGNPPSGYFTTISERIVVVVMEETFSPAEIVLIREGEDSHVQQTRRRFQQVMKDEFIQIVEQATGQKVTAFISDTDAAAAVAVEVFLLGDPRENMNAFEREIADQQDEVGPSERS